MVGELVVGGLVVGELVVDGFVVVLVVPLSSCPMDLTMMVNVSEHPGYSSIVVVPEDMYTSFSSAIAAPMDTRNIMSRATGAIRFIIQK